MPLVEVCLTPAAFSACARPEQTVVVIDVLRATTAICAAFMHGAQAVIPVETVEELRAYAGTDCLLAGERDGIKLDFADFDNDPEAFTTDKVFGRRIAYSTTNGTRAIRLASACGRVLIASWLNFSALCRMLEADGHDVLLLCAGWRDRFSLEDTVLAGALADSLAGAGFAPGCDAAHAACDLWHLAGADVQAYLAKASHRARLERLGLGRSMSWCHRRDLTRCVPRLQDGCLVTG